LDREPLLARDGRVFERDDFERELDERFVVDFDFERLDFAFDDDLVLDGFRELPDFDFDLDVFERDVDAFARLDFDLVPDDDREDVDFLLDDLRELPDFDFELDDFPLDDLASPLCARCLFTVRAAISSARSSERPASRSDSLMC
jgi:hypothetical protein